MFRVSSAVNYHYYPAFIDLRGRPCIVIGGGKVAGRKAASLLLSGAEVTVISPLVTGVIARYIDRKRIKHIKRRYRKGDLKGAFLVIAATSDEAVNLEVSRDAACLLNVVDASGPANFIVPSVIRRGPLAVAVSTSGASPALARSIRTELELLYNRDFGIFADFLAQKRKDALREITDSRVRKRLLKQIASPDVIGMLRKEGLTKTRHAILKLIAEAKKC